MRMGIVVVTSQDEDNAKRYVEALGNHAKTRLITPRDVSSPARTLMEGAGGLLLTGDWDIDPSLYGESVDDEARLKLAKELDQLELGVLRYALEQDIPVLALCRGMQLLNVALGGKLIQDIAGHRSVPTEDGLDPARHQIYVAPGSKLAATLGLGGFFRVNSVHHQGLREAQKAPRLLASAYSVEDGIIEGLESPDHRWVLGVQCRPERQDEVPTAFANLFYVLERRAEAQDISDQQRSESW